MTPALGPLSMRWVGGKTPVLPEGGARDSVCLSPTETHIWPFRETQQRQVLTWFFFLAIIFWLFPARPFSSTRMLAEDPACPVLREGRRLLFWHPGELLAETDVC